MKITILGIGSRGDVQPCVALGVGLKRAGHAVTIGTHRTYQQLVVHHGLEFAPIHGDMIEWLASAEGNTMMQSGRNAIAALRQMRRMMQPEMQKLFGSCLAACEHADAILYASFSILPALSVIEKTGLPSAGVLIYPIHPTRTAPCLMLPRLPSWMPFQSLYCRASYRMLIEANWLMMKKITNTARADALGLPPMSYMALKNYWYNPPPTLHGYSPHVIPKPLDWSESLDVTGYWFVDDPDWQPTAELAAFVEKGPPPAYIGFGSMVNHDPGRTLTAVGRALKDTGLRAVLHCDPVHAKFVTDHADAHVTAYAAHEWLFPRVAAVVHHAGAGTMARALHFGRPNVSVPFFGDQPFWAETGYHLGVSPRPIPFRKLRSDRLAAALRAVTTDKAMQQRAADLGERIRAEDGVARAVEIIEQRLAKPTMLSLSR